MRNKASFSQVLALTDHTGQKRNFLAVIVFSAAIAATVILPHQAVEAKSAPAHAAVDLNAINVNDGFAELVRAVRPAVVNISVTGSASQKGSFLGLNGSAPQLEEFLKRFFGELPEKYGKKYNNRNAPLERKTTAVGSGFIIDPEGLVVTNHHVIEHADSIEVVFEDGSRIPATLKGTDAKTDLALLEIDMGHPLPYVVFGNSDEAEVGDWVVAIGNPFGLGGTTTSGIISARGRDIQSGPLDDFIQIDASINRGNSGGPLFNTSGEVIGVNSAIYSPNGGSVGIGFAIPSSMAENVVRQLAASGAVERGYLGVHIQSLSKEIARNLGLDDDSGALVTQIIENSPAEKAGLEAGDVIVKYDGKTLTKMRDLPRFVALTAEGKTVDVEIWRDESRKVVSVDIAATAEPSLASASADEHDLTNKPLGLELADTDTTNLSRYGLDEETVGVIIVDVYPDSSAARQGLRPGDVIKRLNRTNIHDTKQFIRTLQASIDENKQSVLLLVERENQARFIVVSTAV